MITDDKIPEPDELFIGGRYLTHSHTHFVKILFTYLTSLSLSLSLSLCYISGVRVCASVGEGKRCYCEGVVSEKISDGKVMVKFLDGSSRCVTRSEVRILFRPFAVELPKEFEEEGGETERGKEGSGRGMKRQT